MFSLKTNSPGDNRFLFQCSLPAALLRVKEMQRGMTRHVKIPKRNSKNALPGASGFLMRNSLCHKVGSVIQEGSRALCSPGKGMEEQRTCQILLHLCHSHLTSHCKISLQLLHETLLSSEKIIKSF